MRASVCMRVRVRVRVCACACACVRARARVCVRVRVLAPRPNGRAARREWRGPRRGWERTPQPCVRRRQSRNPRPRPRGVGRFVVVTPARYARAGGRKRANISSSILSA